MSSGKYWCAISHVDSAVPVLGMRTGQRQRFQHHVRGGPSGAGYGAVHRLAVRKRAGLPVYRAQTEIVLENAETLGIQLALLRPFDVLQQCFGRGKCRKPDDRRLHDKDLAFVFTGLAEDQKIRRSLCDAPWFLALDPEGAVTRTRAQPLDCRTSSACASRSAQNCGQCCESFIQFP